MRFFQYLPALKASGIEVVVSPFFDDSYVVELQKGKRSISAVIHGYARRVLAMLSSGHFDLLWIEKDALPWIPAAIEKWLRPARAPYVLDYDDAVFHYYDLHPNPLIRKALGNKHDRLMRSAKLVVAGNSYLAERAFNAGASWVEIVPTVIDLDRYPNISQRRSNASSFTVGWIGSASTSKYLRPIEGPIRELSGSGDFHFVTVGAGSAIADLPIEMHEWGETTEVDQIKAFDVGIMPLPDAPFERGKCGYKLIQYMACSKPVVASPVGVNASIVEDGVNGFLAETPEEWQFALTRLRNDPELCASMGKAGREKVEREYSLQATAPRLVSLLRRAADMSDSA
jgi:glycosyltransferase involved in cell wall biosynthesis